MHLQMNYISLVHREHVFADLRAYICVNKDCSDLSFPDSGGWIEHEFDAHRRAWKCDRCSETYTTRGQFVDHMASLHSNDLSKNQLSELVEICWFQRPQVPADDCPFCEEWAVRLRETNQHVPHDLPVLVSKKQYQQHVGAHMEQLALFAVSQFQADRSETESQNINAVGEADHIGATGSDGDAILSMGSSDDLATLAMKPPEPTRAEQQTSNSSANAFLGDKRMSSRKRLAKTTIDTDSGYSSSKIESSSLFNGGET